MSRTNRTLKALSSGALALFLAACSVTQASTPAPSIPSQPVPVGGTPSFAPYRMDVRVLDIQQAMPRSTATDSELVQDLETWLRQRVVPVGNDGVARARIQEASLTVRDAGVGSTVTARAIVALDLTKTAGGGRAAFAQITATESVITSPAPDEYAIDEAGDIARKRVLLTLEDQLHLAVNGKLTPFVAQR